MEHQFADDPPPLPDLLPSFASLAEVSPHKKKKKKRKSSKKSPLDLGKMNISMREEESSPHDEAPMALPALEEKQKSEDVESLEDLEDLEAPETPTPPPPPPPLSDLANKYMEELEGDSPPPIPEFLPSMDMVERGRSPPRRRTNDAGDDGRAGERRRSLSERRRTTMGLSKEFVALDGVDPVPSIHSPASRKAGMVSVEEHLMFYDNDEEYGSGGKGLMSGVDWDREEKPVSPASLPMSLQSPVSTLSSPVGDFSGSKASNGTLESNGLQAKALVVKLLGSTVKKHQRTVRLSRSFFKLKSLLLEKDRSRRPSATETPSPELSVRKFSVERDIAADEPRVSTIKRKMSVNSASSIPSRHSRSDSFDASSSSLPELHRELTRLREKVRQQEGELRRVRRQIVIHSIFFKWKIWFLVRVQERMEIEMEEERLMVANRILEAQSKLQRRLVQ